MKVEETREGGEAKAGREARGLALSPDSSLIAALGITSERASNSALYMVPSNLPNRVHNEHNLRLPHRHASIDARIESLPRNITYESRCTAASGEHGLRAVALCFQFHFQTFPPTARRLSNKRYRGAYLFLDGARHPCGTF